MSSGRILYIQHGPLSERPSPPPSKSFAFHDIDAGTLYLVDDFMQYVEVSGGTGLPTVDTTSIVEDPVDDTKEMRIDVGNVSTSTIRTLFMPDADVDLKKNNYSASTSPTSTDDDSQGYDVGSIWIDTTADIGYICLDATTSSAIWERISFIIGTDIQAWDAQLDDLAGLSVTADNTIRADGGNWTTIGNNFNASVSPTASNDNTEGYSVGSIWIDTTADKSYIALDVSTSAAVWTEITIGLLDVYFPIDVTDTRTIPENRQLVVSEYTINGGSVTIDGRLVVISGEGGTGEAEGSGSLGDGVLKTISGGVVDAGLDRNLIIAAETGTDDNLTEITGINVGERVWLRADTGDLITVIHNDVSATNKIRLYGNINAVLSEDNPMELLQVATSILSFPQDAAWGFPEQIDELYIVPAGLQQFAGEIVLGENGELRVEGDLYIVG